jgi:DNA-binding FadR family transcriptional regulator
MLSTTMSGQKSRIEPASTSPTYEVVASNIRRAIQLRRYLPGDRLPPERELARIINVSRSSLREAIRMLVGEGLVEVCRGPPGGLVVLSPRISKHEAHEILGQQEKQLEEIFDFRVAVECAAVRLAATRRRDQDLKHLGSLLQRMEELTASRESRSTPENLPKFLAADTAFHLGIAHASQNSYMLTAIEDARARMFHPIGTYFTKRIDDYANDRHADIFSAIARKYPDKAECFMQEHIDRTRREVRRYLRGGNRRS